MGWYRVDSASKGHRVLIWDVLMLNRGFVSLIVHLILFGLISFPSMVYVPLWLLYTLIIIEIIDKKWFPVLGKKIYLFCTHDNVNECPLKVHVHLFENSEEVLNIL